jgi:Flp pilus assembly protein TadG
MRLRNPSQIQARRRSAKTLVLFVLVAPVLLGMIGMIIDGGILMAAYRQTQNAADAASMAAAMDLLRGSGTSTALATAQSFVNSNGMSGVTLTLKTDQSGTNNVLNIPPATGPYSTGSTNVNYAEVIVSQTVNTLFIQILGVNSSQTVTARAVAGYEPVGAGEGVMVLDPTVSTGVTAISNNVQLIVNGDITINANGKGLDQYGQTVGTGTGGASLTTATSTRSTPTIIAQTIFTVGGTNNLGNIATYDPAYSGFYNPSNPNPSGLPLFAPSGIAPDPLINLATPTVTKNYYSYSKGTGFLIATSPQSVSFGNGDTVTLPLGIYSDVTISNGATVTLSPGITVIAGSNGLTMHGGTLQDLGKGVMIYNTAASYNPDNGTPDSSDGGTKPTTTVGGGVTIDGGSTINVSPLTAGPFSGMVFYQRRGDNSPLTVTGNSSNINFSGSAGQISTLYAKWAGFTLAGTGKYDAQFLVGTLTINGGAQVTINAAGKLPGRGNLVFLVE